MNDLHFYLRGLNYRVPDREAAPGDCRVLHNLYPAGRPPEVVWRPASPWLPFYSDPDAAIVSAGAWIRSNMPPALVYLARGATDTVRMVELDGIGNPIGTPVTLIDLTNSSAARVAEFVPVGEHLVISLMLGGNPENIYIAQTHENVTVCLPFNIDALPIVTVQPNDQAGSNPYFSLRFAYELHDGTIVRMTQPEVRQYSYAENSPTTLEFEAQSVVPQGYDKLVRGIACFVSTPGNDITDVLSNQRHYKVGTIVKSGSAGKVTFLLKTSDALPLLTRLAEFPQADEDALTDHAIYPSVVSSYNKLTLLGGAVYDFARPYAGVQPAGVPIYFTPPQNRQRTDSPDTNNLRLNRTVTLSWTEPPGNVTGYVIEMYLDAWYEVLALGRWVRQRAYVPWAHVAFVQPGQTSIAVPVQVTLEAPPTIRYISHVLSFRIRAQYGYNSSAPEEFPQPGP